MNNNINLNLYKTFYEVAKYKSISKAASKNYISQSAVSKAIKKLESELNTELIYRSVKGIELTDKGKELLFYLKKAYNNLEIARRVMLESNTLKRGKLAIGVPSQIGSFFLFDKITKFHHQYPQIEITIISKSTSQLLSLLESHEIDFIIDTTPIKTKLNDIKVIPLKKVHNCFVKASSFPTSSIKTLKDLEKYPLILPIKGTNNRDELDILFDKNNIQVKNIINIHTSEMIISAIKKRLGIGYVIYDLVQDEIANKSLEMINLKEKLPMIEINLVYIKNYLTTAPIYFIENYLDYKL